MSAFAEPKPEGISVGHIARLSPLQRRILRELRAGPLTLPELSSCTGSSVFSLGRQLSLLCLRAKCDYMEKRGIRVPLVKKSKGAGMRTTYSIAFDASILVD